MQLDGDVSSDVSYGEENYSPLVYYNLGKRLTSTETHCCEVTSNLIE